MEIRSKSEISPLADILNEAIAALDANVDRSELTPFTIQNDEQYAEVGEGLIEDKRQIELVEQTLQPFGRIAFKAHRTITGKIAEYQAYGKNRYAIRDAALVEWKKAKDAADAEENRRAQAVAEQEESRRKAAEVKELQERAKKEQRPDLAVRAEEIKKAPAREVHVALGRAEGPKVKGLGMKTRYKATVVDEDALILAVGRRPAYIELARLMNAKAKDRKTAKKDKARYIDLAALLSAMAMELPEIPLSVLEPKATTITGIANDTNGRINWPGVSIDEETKSTTRIR